MHSNFLTIKNTFVVSTESWGGKRTSAGTSSSCCQFIQPSSNSPVKEIKTVIKHDQIYESLALPGFGSAVNEWLPRSWATNADCHISWPTNTEHYFHLASFPGRSHFQYLIAYSMQIRRGKAWEILSRAVTSGRQKVDTRGAVPDEESQSPFLYYRSGGWRPEC